MNPSLPQLVHKAEPESRPRRARSQCNKTSEIIKPSGQHKMFCIFPLTPFYGFSVALVSGQNSATMIDSVFPPYRIHFPLHPQTQQVVHRLVIRTSLLLNGGTSAQLPVVNWLVQAVTQGGGWELHWSDLLYFKSTQPLVGRPGIIHSLHPSSARD